VIRSSVGLFDYIETSFFLEESLQMLSMWWILSNLHLGGDKPPRQKALLFPFMNGS